MWEVVGGNHQIRNNCERFIINIKTVSSIFFITIPSVTPWHLAVENETLIILDIIFASKNQHGTRYIRDRDLH